MVLVAKEVPFLLWAAATQLQRADVAQAWTRELLVARSMGYGPRAAWWRVLWPQLWPRLRWPMLAMLTWRWLLDADLTLNARGAASAWLLALVLAVVAGFALQVPRQRLWRARWTTGERGAAGNRDAGAHVGAAGFPVLAFSYLMVMLALGVSSVAGIWPFPALLPQTITGQAWVSVAGSFATVWTTLTLALTSALAALLWSVAWLECAPPLLHNRLNRVIYLPLVLPPVLWVVGVHGMTLNWGINATWVGLWLVHTLATLPYVLIALSPTSPALAHAFVTLPRLSAMASALRSLTAAYAWLQWLLPVLGFGLAAWLGKPRRY